jgi:hypothetical protein
LGERRLGDANDACSSVAQAFHNLWHAAVIQLWYVWVLLAAVGVGRVAYRLYQGGDW